MGVQLARVLSSVALVLLLSVLTVFSIFLNMVLAVEWVASAEASAAASEAAIILEV
jgi:hypothetical protein